MTEDEAKTKWCPQTRLGDKGNRSNSFGVDYTFGRCIASECMAWRSTSSQHGYCGLAGRPRV